MILAVLAPVCTAQKHPQQQHARDGHPRKEARPSLGLFSPIFAAPTLKAKGIFWREDRKCPPSAKVGLGAAGLPRREHIGGGVSRNDSVSELAWGVPKRGR